MSFRSYFLPYWSLLVVLAGLAVLPHPALSDDLTAETYVQRGYLLAAQGEYSAAISNYQQAIALSPQLPVAYNNLAWVWATALDDEVRNGANAVEYATKACELSDWKNAVFIDTLASAYAEVGDFDSAIEWQSKAIELDPRDELRQRLDLYREGKPYRESLAEREADRKPFGPRFDSDGREYFEILFEPNRYNSYAYWYTGRELSKKEIMSELWPGHPARERIIWQKQLRRTHSWFSLFMAGIFCSGGAWHLAAPDSVWKSSGEKGERTARWDRWRVINGAFFLGIGLVFFLQFLLSWVI